MAVFPGGDRRHADVRSLLRPGGPFGPLLEGFVLMELARQLTWSRQRAELFHYRTKDKIEVDAILENRQETSSESR
jgi:predicted AAA+ superfamily ATPase